MRRSWGRVVRFLAAVVAAVGAAPAPTPDWFPLAVGHEWRFQIGGELTGIVSGQPTETEPLDADSEIRIERVVTDFGTPTSEVLFLGWTSLAGNELLATIKLYVAANADGLFVHARRIEDTDGASPVQRFSPPWRTLALPAKAGAKWTVGTDAVAGVKETTTAEVLGFEAVTVPAGPFAGCLKVRDTGKLTGKVDTPGGPLTIESGSRTQLSWYADGVGPVKSLKKYHIIVKEPSGLKGTVKVTITRDLTYHRAPEE